MSAHPCSFDFLGLHAKANWAAENWEIKFGLEFDPVRFERSVWCQLSFSLFNWLISEPEAIFQFDRKHQSYHDRTKFKHVRKRPHKHVQDVLTSTLSSPICLTPLNMSDLIKSVNSVDFGPIRTNELQSNATQKRPLPNAVSSDIWMRHIYP